MKFHTNIMIAMSSCLLLLTLQGCHSKTSDQTNEDSTPTSNHLIQKTDASDNLNNQNIPEVKNYKLHNLNEFVLDGFASQEIQTEIRHCFDEFKDAVTKYQGNKAASMMSDSSLEYYNSVLIAAKTALHDSKNYEIISRRFPPSVRTMSSLIVKRMTPEFIDSATPLKLYETGFNQGWIGYQSLASASLDNITAYHKQEIKYYTADFYYEHTISDKYVLSIGFELNNNTCKIDLVPLFAGIDQIIENYIKEKKLNPELMFQETMENSESALNPDNWKPYPAEQDNFLAYFPKSPVLNTTSDEHIYTASHHLYGQFNVSVTYYTPGENTPYHQKKLRDQAIMDFLVSLNAPKPLCTAGILKDDPLIRCDFTIPDMDAKGKALWLFTKDRMYLINNVARSSQFNEDVANSFFERFRYISE